MEVSGRVRRAARGALAGLVLAALAGAASADTVGPSGLKLPRFASVRADKVNVRTGPGLRYPVEWVFVRRDLPVEITAEFDTWRRIRDFEGVGGWVHQSTLSGRRTVVVTAARAPLRARPAGDSRLVAQLDARVIARLLGCDGAWCRIDIDGHRGWVARTAVWGAAADE